jgi:hypothetical protein
MRATLRGRHLGGHSESATSTKAGSPGSLVLARFIGYYGLLGAAAVGTLLIR